MADPRNLLETARDILDSAARDLDRGWRESACVSAQRAAVLATQAWLESRGQVYVSASVRENVALAPGLDPDVAAAATRLDRHRIDEGTPYGSGPEADATEARRVVEAGWTVLGFVESRMER